MKGLINSDEEGLYNLLSKKDIIGRAHFQTFDEVAKQRKELLEAAKAGDPLAIEIIKIRFNVTKWVVGGHVII